ncbi:cbb3-type cytochrome c oxidase subunit 3 [Amaricoccus sp.]|uniref:cbb3-type cytochrome c oxidase subunit 3 n=1 Tax=Amaricoccus sp. TaxID=1872485 RepID=UPI001B4A2495|nr:cbb3-type cytochrome c oxidase subunit 3 [Amaricoccus sp.]MBP7241305.1 cbb3-type cytochrome c oxidase subunit 3 [Amaricoccus sp.]
METYTFLRTLADSWGMLAMLVIFAGVVFWAFRPGSRKAQDDAANQIFRNEDKPKDDGNGH